MTTAQFALPYPPSINHYYRVFRNRTVISAEGRAFRETVIQQLRSEKGLPLLGTLDVALSIHPPDRRRRDVDNVQKALLDALQHAGVFADDNQVKRLVSEMMDVDRAGGFVAVDIQPYCVRVTAAETKGEET